MRDGIAGVPAVCYTSSVWPPSWRGERVSEIIVRRRHALGLAWARRIAETMAERLREDFGGSYAWDGDTLRFRRMGASGHVAVTPERVEIRVNVSVLLSPLHARIEREIVDFCDARLKAPVAKTR